MMFHQFQGGFHQALVRTLSNEINDPPGYLAGVDLANNRVTTVFKQFLDLPDPAYHYRYTTTHYLKYGVWKSFAGSHGQHQIGRAVIYAAA